MSSDEIRKQILGTPSAAPQESQTKKQSSTSDSLPSGEVSRTPSQNPSKPTRKTDVSSAANSENKANPVFKRLAIAIALALVFGPVGLIYISWKRSGLLTLIFLVFWTWQPQLFFVWWSGFSVAAVVLFGVGQPGTSAPDVGFRSKSYRRQK
jgi:hypothetical protein